MTVHTVCITPRSTKTEAIVDTNKICLVLGWDLTDLREVPLRPPPPEDMGGFNPVPWESRPRSGMGGQVQSLGLRRR